MGERYISACNYKILGMTLGLLFFSACMVRLPLLTKTGEKPVPGMKAPSAYAPGQRPYEQDGVWYFPIASAQGYEEEGIASWYGREFHGRPTSSGVPYDMHALTAAHKTLPLGTYVKVLNLKNRRSVVLCVNDRGPFVSGRIIDLSFRVARMLDVVQAGTAPVRIEAIQLAVARHAEGQTRWAAEPIPNFRYGRFCIQVGAFRMLENAQRLKDAMSGRFSSIRLQGPGQEPLGYYRVQVGEFRDLIVAREKTEDLKQQGFDGAFVVAMEDKNVYKIATDEQ